MNVHMHHHSARIVSSDGGGDQIVVVYGEHARFVRHQLHRDRFARRHAVGVLYPADIVRMHTCLQNGDMVAVPMGKVVQVTSIGHVHYDGVSDACFDEGHGVF